jgi:transposase
VVTASSIRESAAWRAFCGIGRVGQGDQRLYCGRHGQDRAGSEGSKRARSSAASTSLSGSDWKLGLYRNGFLVRLAEAGLPVICVETRHTCGRCCRRRINKIDQNDARGITQMMRVGLYRPVHVKTLRGQKLRMLLTHRKLIQSKAIAIDNDLRGTLRNFGLKVGVVGTVKFEARIKELIENLPDLAVLVEPLLMVRRVLREQFASLHRRLLAIVRDDEV